MKILVVRFSSIGDIVLTTPVLRALKTQLPSVEVHYLTKRAFASVIGSNPNVDRLHTIDKSIDEIIPALREEQFDWIIDLHNNIRTKALKSKLKRPYKAFPKLNLQKWLLVKFKIDKMPDVHVVDRYFEAVKHLGVENDKQPCEFPVNEHEAVDVYSAFALQPKSYVCIVLGAKFKTKQLPQEKVVELVDQLSDPIVFIGGPEDKALGEEIMAKTAHNKTYNACGAFSLQGSASIVAQSKKVLTNDTGMMHIASGFDVPIVSIWGNTVPSLGMYPYRPANVHSFTMHEVKGLGCRPCSKIGYEKCPKGHFKCMMEQDMKAIITDLTRE